MMEKNLTPKQLDLKRDHALTITWSDDSVSVFPIGYLRKMSPSAEMKELRDEMASNPLTVLPDKMGTHQGPLTVTDAEMVGNYAIKLTFSDGHKTGIFSWTYLQSIDQK